MKEAKSHDEARIQSIKDDMDSVLIFVCIFLYCPAFSLMRRCLGRFILRRSHFLYH
jgi:hypothetical protein